MFDLEDTEGMMRCIIWPEQFAAYEELVKPDAILVVRGAIDKRPGSEEANLIVNELIALDDLPSRCTRGVMIRVLEESHGIAKLEQLQEVLRSYPGNCELQLMLCLADGSRVACKCDGLRLAVSGEMRSRVDGLLGLGNLRLLTSKSPNGNGRR